MALNPYTLYHLYDKGILECVPTDLTMPTPMGAMMPMTNPYLNMAQTGGLYQNHGTHTDSFEIQSPYVNQTATPVPSQVQIGSMSRTGGMNAFNGYGIGAGSQATTAGMFGFNDATGAYTQAGGMNVYNGAGIGAQNQSGGMNIFGGFSDTKNRLADGYYRTMSVVDRTPKFILGLAAAGIAILGIKSAFKGGKLFGKKPAPKAKPAGFWTKLNPKNWFKKVK